MPVPLEDAKDRRVVRRASHLIAGIAAAPGRVAWAEVALVRFHVPAKQRWLRLREKRPAQQEKRFVRGRIRHPRPNPSLPRGGFEFEQPDQSWPGNTELAWLPHNLGTSDLLPNL